MIAKLKEKNDAIALRKTGMSLRDIVKIVPVAKSTVSLWLKEVRLSKPQKQRLTQKKRDAALRGALRRKTDRIALTKKIFSDAAKDVKSFTKKDLWLMGTMLYWAEGAKEKTYRPGSGVRFTNSDPDMVRLFIKWLEEICCIDRGNIICDIYIHDTRRDVVSIAISHWAKHTGFPVESFTRIYFKKGNPKTLRKNIGDTYFGIIRVSVRSSSTLQRKIAGWVQAINEYYWGVV